MTTFKTIFKIMWKEKFQIFLYTGIILCICILNSSTGNTTMSFEDVKPVIKIVNNDSSNISKSFENYLYDHGEKFEGKTDNDEDIDDALFYRFLDYVLVIPDGFGTSIEEGLKPTIEYKENSNFNASFIHMIVTKYIKTLETYSEYYSGEELINKTTSTIDNELEVELTSKIDFEGNNLATSYFNFTNYAMMAVCVYIVCIILADMKEPNIAKRNNVSSMKITTLNKNIMLACSVLTILLWILYCLIGVFFFGNVLLSSYGVAYAINLLVFSFTCLTLGLLIGNITANKEAIGGIINSLAIGSSFLCGCFVPIEFMPESVVNAGKILPTYWFVRNNEIIKTAEVFDQNIIKSLINNGLILIGYIIIFVIITNIISKKKSRIG